MSGKYCLPISIECRHSRALYILLAIIYFGPCLLLFAYSGIEFAIGLSVLLLPLWVSEYRLQRNSQEIRRVVVNTAGSWMLVSLAGQDTEVDIAAHSILFGVIMLKFSSHNRVYRIVVVQKQSGDEQFHRLKLFLKI